MLSQSNKSHYSNNKTNRKDAVNGESMNISLTRVYLECMLAYVLSGINAAINVLIIYQDKVSVKNKKTLVMIVDRLTISNETQQKEYFDLLLKNMD